MPTLNWIGKDEVIKHNPPYHTLEKKYTFGAENSENMIIKGDNLLALKSLWPKYEGKIKCINIDPPYNTGNENWVYNDNVNSPKIKKWLGEVVAKDDLSRHDKWLCMMLPRLKLLHRLLSDDGVIFISIDDNEMANLKLLCDEIFGCGNVETYIWCLQDDTEGSFPKTRKYTVRKEHDYIICCFKTKIKFNKYKSDRNYKKDAFSNPDNDPKGAWFSGNMSRNSIKSTTGSKYYTITTPTGKEYTRNWTISKEGCEYKLKNNEICFANGGNGVPRLKIYKNSEQYSIQSSLFTGLHTSINGGKELKAIFEKEIFDYPKPTDLIKRILEIATDKNSIILDSFAGSGTTAHAVLELNKKDGGNRKFILVEMEDYAENITAERVRRVIKGYGKEPENSATGGDFSFYELGDRLLEENGNINENISIEKIREYIYFSETKEKCEQKGSDFLGECNGVAYYLAYNKNEPTTLNIEYLAKIKKASSYVVYADACVLSEDTMMKYNITFKKIPRDIKKV